MNIAKVTFPRLTLLVALLCWFAPLSHAGEVRTRIETVNGEFAAAVARGDAAGIAALYTSDGKVLPTGSEPVHGTAAIQKLFQGFLDAGVARAKLQTQEVYGGGKLATEVGVYELSDKTGTLIDHGKYIVIWRQVDGQWKLHRDMFNTSVTPPAENKPTPTKK